jgi:hypothetical protein
MAFIFSTNYLYSLAFFNSKINLKNNEIDCFSQLLKCLIIPYN